MDSIGDIRVVAGRVVGQKIARQNDKWIETESVLALLADVQKRLRRVPLHIADEISDARPNNNHRPAVDFEPVRVGNRLIKQLVVVIPQKDPIDLLADIKWPRLRLQIGRAHV